MRILQEKGFILRLTPVVEATVPDRPGGLNELLSAVAEAGIDIEYMYSSRSIIALGGSKSGNPWARLMAPTSMAIRVIRRMTESVNSLFLLLISCMVLLFLFLV